MTTWLRRYFANRPTAQAVPKRTFRPAIEALEGRIALSVSYATVNDWGSGLEGKIQITNDQPAVIRGWRVEFDYNRTIDDLWDGVLVSHVGNHYVVENASYNATFSYPEGGAIEYVKAIASEVPAERIALSEPLVGVDLASRTARTPRRELRFQNLVSSAPFPRLLQLAGVDFDPAIYTWNQVLVFNLGFDGKGADALQLLGDHELQALDDRHHGDDRGDADDDPQGGEDRAQLVGAQGRHRDAEVLGDDHGADSEGGSGGPPSGARAAAAPGIRCASSATTRPSRITTRRSA